MSEFFFVYAELWEETINPQHRHTPFAISKMHFSEKLYIGQKIPHESFETYGQDRFWPFSACCFKISSGVLAFWDIYCDIYRPAPPRPAPPRPAPPPPKEQSECRPVNLCQNCLQNWYTFRK